MKYHHQCVVEGNEHILITSANYVFAFTGTVTWYESFLKIKLSLISISLMDPYSSLFLWVYANSNVASLGKKRTNLETSSEKI